jgi:hypothetical protein
LGFYELVQTFGWPIGSTIFAVICLYFDVVVPGKRHREVCRQRDRLLRLALRGQRKAWQTADLVEAVVPPVGSEDDDVRAD